MTIEQAISKAVAGGWDALEWHDIIKMDEFRAPDVHSRIWGQSELGEAHGMTLGEVLLSPDFWRALGKTEGWPDMLKGVVSLRGNDGWQQRWHSLIYHLADGGTIESYFETL